MEWDDKVKLIQIGNTDDRKALQEFVLEHIDTFDDQAYEMFALIVNLNPSEMEEDIEFYKVLYPKIKDIDYNKFGFRPSMRLAMLNTICEEKLKLN